MNRQNVKSLIRAAGFGLILFFPATAMLQVTQDSTGHIPAIRTHITPPSNAITWWQRLGEQHLLDFSEKQNKVVVDPIVQVMAGTVQFTGNEQEDLTFWDNIRGARFQAELDGQFHIGGELLERQGVADPLLGTWAVQRRIPGWGRSKLGRNNAWNTIDRAYYDASRARGWTGWSNGMWSADGGIDALHFGAGRASVLQSKTAAPAPYARFGFEQNKHRSEIIFSQWMSDQRGPLGETAESLLNRSQVITLNHTWGINRNWLIQGAYQFIREKSASIAEEGWESLGYSAGEEYRAKRHVIAMEGQFHFNFRETVNAVAFFQQSADVGAEPRRVITSDASHQPVLGLTNLAGFRAEADGWQLLVEAYQQSEATCSSCFHYEGLSNDISGPRIASLEHAGMTMHGNWKKAVRIQANAQLTNAWSFAVSGEHNDAANWFQVETSYTIHTVWPMRFFCNAGVAEDRHGFQLNYRWASFGLHAAVQRWK
jgi:hypothetical protein